MRPAVTTRDPLHFRLYSFGWLINKRERGREEAVVGNLWHRYYPGTCPEGLRTPQNPSVGTAVLRAKIWTEAYGIGNRSANCWTVTFVQDRFKKSHPILNTITVFKYLKLFNRMSYPTEPLCTDRKWFSDSWRWRLTYSSAHFLTDKQLSFSLAELWSWSNNVFMDADNSQCTTPTLSLPVIMVRFHLSEGSEAGVCWSHFTPVSPSD
jgi:hypothetical protein